MSWKEFNSLAAASTIASPLAPYEKALLIHYTEYYRRFRQVNTSGKPLYEGFTENLFFLYSFMTLLKDVENGGLTSYYYQRGISFPFVTIRNFGLIEASDVEKAVNQVTDVMLKVFKRLKKEKLGWTWKEFASAVPYERLKEVEELILQRKQTMSIKMVDYIQIHPTEFCILIQD